MKEPRDYLWKLRNCKSYTTCRYAFDTDPNGEPFLAELHIEPGGETIKPPFDKYAVKIYQMEVAFKTMVVRIWGRALLCRYQVRLNMNVDVTRLVLR